MTVPGPSRGLRTVEWLLLGVALIAFAIVMLIISESLTKHAVPSRHVIARASVLGLAAGMAYLMAVWILRMQGGGRVTLGWIILVGAVMRVLLMPSEPVLEDDFYRYLWDGSVVANGHDPYALSPRQVMEHGGDVPAELVDLADASGHDVIHRINHPELRTIYPPVAQGVFALAYSIKPFSLVAWRGVLLAFDVATMLLLIALLRELRRSAAWSLVYWCNPLMVQQTICAAHMDVIVLPLLLGALLLAVRRHIAWAMVPLALATATKLWPVLLVPLMLRPLLGRRFGQLILAGGVYALLSVVLLWPMLAATLTGDSESGAVAYGMRWYNNSAIYLSLIDNFQPVVNRLFGEEFSYHSHAWARVTLGVLILAWTVWMSWRPWTRPEALVRRSMWIIAGLFLLSPTQFPWYFLWMLPLLAAVPVWPLLIYTALLPLYPLHYYWETIVWIEHAPVWIWLAADAMLRLRRRRRAQYQAQPA